MPEQQLASEEYVERVMRAYDSVAYDSLLRFFKRIVSNRESLLSPGDELAGAIAGGIYLTALGDGKDVIKILDEVGNIDLFEPLVAGVRLVNGETEFDIRAPWEIFEMAEDIVQRVKVIRKLKDQET